MLIQLTAGHHNFGAEAAVESFDASGKSLGKVKTVAPGAIFEVPDKDFEAKWSYRAKAFKLPVSEEIVYTEEGLKALSVKELRAEVKSLGGTGYSKLKEDELIAMVLELHAAKEEEDITPSPEWGTERLKGYLDEEEVEYEADASDEDLLALALAQFQA